ncbi:MAG: hypothetical protein O2911_08295 [Bacteroidetes bacterium]|nr:hypothetical protein [Bacteroidota bacterium]
MSDIRIPYGQSRGRGFVSLILHGHYPHQDCEWCRSDRKNNLDEEKYIFIAY